MINEYIRRLKKTLDNLNREEIKRLVRLLMDAKKRGSTIYIFGNGGSGSTASHFACDIGKVGQFKVVSLNDNMAVMTAHANDFGYENVFIMQLKTLLKDGDVVIGISGSGNSGNVLKAIDYANYRGNITCGITGYDGGQLRKMAMFSVNANVNDMQMAEDIHLIINHILVKLLTGSI